MKIFVLMGVDWKFIKQRPHFIAEGLDNGNNDVTVIYKKQNRRDDLQKEGRKKIRKIGIRLIPFISRINLGRAFNEKILSSFVKACIKYYKPEILYVTSLLFYESIPSDYKGKVIYDCCDDFVEFTDDLFQKKSTEIRERRLIHRCNAVVFTSEKLKETVCRRYHIECKTYVVRNAFGGSIIENKANKNTNDGKFIICYIGAVRTWFDFDVINKSIVECPNIEYWIVGPIAQDVRNCFQTSQNIKLFGTVENDMLFEYAERADVLVMPFKPNRLIESVDPIKLYEYINFNKNIICVYYKEVERFQSFVYFYKTYDEYIKVLRLLQEKNNLKYSLEERTRFLKSNNWRNRCVQISEIISSL